MLYPLGFAEAILRDLGALFMCMTYGHIAKEDLVILTAHQATGYYVQGFMCYFWVDYIPLLRFLPDWFPGTGFKRLGKEVKALLDRFANEPFDEVLGQMYRGQMQHISYSSRLLDEKDGLGASPEDINLIRWSCAGMFDTLHPEIAGKAQLEIDTVTGWDRLPNLEDMSHMPYLNALLQEVMRTYPCVSLDRFTKIRIEGVPHCASEDIHFRGYLIPKGAIIYPNIWYAYNL
ncbi:hypothetical protein FRC10_011513 [Ceratobasidium sp. 414]|nr:hypothetical protein FRC10_011513 [Ceratobasidium sp. 414]